jgi:hypothetical protein
MSTSNEDSLSGRGVGFSKAAGIPNVLGMLEMSAEMTATTRNRGGRGRNVFPRQEEFTM